MQRDQKEMCSSRLQKLEDAAIWALEHVFIVLEEGQTQLRFQHVDRREFSLYLVNPQMHRAKLEVVFPSRYPRAHTRGTC